MALTIGVQLGSHEITALLGKGGMGEVYRARDLKLKREVAIKILPEEFSRDTDRVSRFQREAEVLASLNHPNIAAIHDLEETAGTRYLVLELVEGETLAERIARGPIQIDEALTIAKQICEALEAAHEKGIIHRDLKPANVKITPDGKVKVLDFGLAKAVSQSAATTISNSPTMLSGTMGGVITGTAGYMSPEQTKGVAGDQRSDIFSFGCVLFEMVTGRKAFTGDTVPEILAGVLRMEPDWGLIPDQSSFPSRLPDLIKRCLNKDPRRRWYAIGDVRIELELLATNNETTPKHDRVRLSAAWKWVSICTFAAGLFMLAIAARSSMLQPMSAVQVTRLTIPLNETQSLSNTSRPGLAISPDGREIVYMANLRLYRRSLAEFSANPIPGTDLPGGVSEPVFSPDGGYVAFYSNADRAIDKIPLGGGIPIKIGTAVLPNRLAWDADGIVFNDQQRGIVRVRSTGSEPEVLVLQRPDEAVLGGEVLPASDEVLFVSVSSGMSRSQLLIENSKSHQRTVLVDGATDGRYIPGGYIAFIMNGVLFAAPFDMQRLRLKREPVAMVEGIRTTQYTMIPAGQFAFSANGVFVYIPSFGKGSDARVLAITDEAGVLQTLRMPPGNYGFPRISPDGKRMLFEIDERQEAALAIYDLVGNTAIQRLTFTGSNRYPVWSADGQRVFYQSNRGGDLAIWSQRIDGEQTAERISNPSAGEEHIPDSLSPDGKVLSMTVLKANESSIWTYSFERKTAAPFAIVPSRLLGRSAFSPDGKWLAYQSNEIKRGEIYLQPFPPNGSKFDVATADGDNHHPQWSRNGKQLFFVQGPGQFAFVNVTIGTSPTFSEPVRVAPPGVMSAPSIVRNYDVMPDGKHFVGIFDSPADAGKVVPPQINVVLNWFTELQRSVPAK